MSIPFGLVTGLPDLPHFNNMLCSPWLFCPYLSPVQSSGPGNSTWRGVACSLTPYLPGEESEHRVLLDGVPRVPPG